eukprot:314817-Prorocentrum_lima.AAC.1
MCHYCDQGVQPHCLLSDGWPAKLLLFKDLVCDTRTGQLLLVLAPGDWACLVWPLTACPVPGHTLPST